MATTSFDYIRFLMKLNPDLLSQYAKKHEISLITKEGNVSEKIAGEFLKMVEKEPLETQGKFWNDAHEIDEIGTAKGCDYLLNRATTKNLDINQVEYEESQNSKERALYFYLNFPELFFETINEYELENLQGWRAEKTICKLLKEIIPNIPELKGACKKSIEKNTRVKI